MLKKELEVKNELGIHARVASRITREAKRFESSIIVRKGEGSYDFKNVTGVITVNAKRGSILKFEFDGPDEDAAAEAITALFASKFGER